MDLFSKSFMSLIANPLFGILLSLMLFVFGQWLFNKSKGFFLFQPLFVAMVLGILILVGLGHVFNMSTADFYKMAYKPGGDMIFWVLTPATIAFAVPLYKRNDVLRKNWAVIAFSLFLGTVVSLFAITFLCKLLQLSHEGTASMLSQSATTAIALPLTAAIDGNPSLTAMACILNAVIIYALGERLIKWFGLEKEPIGVGLGLGTAGHTIGSAFALKLGSIEGAMGAVAVVIIGVVDNIVVPLFAHFMNI